MNGLQAAGRTTIIPDLVRMQALMSVQQPCSNPSKYPEMPGNVSLQEYGNLQAFCKLQKRPANYHAAFTRQRSLVRTQHCPLKKYLQIYRKREAPGIHSRGSLLQRELL
jgi:hypothetical protein